MKCGKLTVNLVYLEFNSFLICIQKFWISYFNFDNENFDFTTNEGHLSQSESNLDCEKVQIELEPRLKSALSLQKKERKTNSRTSKILTKLTHHHLDNDHDPGK